MVFWVRGIVEQVLDDHTGRAVAHLASGDVAVFDVSDGGFCVVGGEVVDDNFAVWAELGRKGGGDLF